MSVWTHVVSRLYNKAYLSKKLISSLIGAQRHSWCWIAECVSPCRKVDAKISELLADRDLSRTWIHVDLDAFFASVAELDDPSLVKHISPLH